jgi:ABC-2 type transport system permease protein
MELIRRGKISVGIVIPPDFERRRYEGREAVQILVDGSDTAVQSAVIQLAQVPVNSSAQAPITSAARVPATSTPPTGAVNVVSFYNPERRSAVNIVPGLIGVILTMTMVLFTAIAIVRERERGNMELLIATPLTSAELMIGKVLPYIAIGFIQTSVVLALGIWLFKVPVIGSFFDVYITAGLLILANLSMGLLISTRAQSQFQAMQMAFFVLLPSILMSGFMFPFAGMPKPIQYFAEILPLTHFLRLIRGVMLRGGSLRELWPDVAALLAFTFVMMTLAIMRFRKRLD